MRALIVGCGSLGKALVQHLLCQSISVYTIHHDERPPDFYFDIIVFTHGWNENGSLDDTNLEQIQAAIAGNVGVVLNIMRQVHLMPQARVVVVGSLWSLRARAHKLAYTISKTALQGLVRGLAAETSNYYINLLCPSAIENEMTATTLPLEQKTAQIQQTPFKRLLYTQEFCNAVYGLVHAPHGITGQTIPCDLGLSVVGPQ